MSASIASIRFGANRGSRILRYFECFGGSTLRGISGRTFAERHHHLRREQLVVLEDELRVLAGEGEGNAVQRAQQRPVADHLQITLLWARRRKVFVHLQL